MKEVVIGIDIGGGFTKYGIVDRDGNCLEEDFITTDTYKEFDAYLENLHAVIDNTLQSVSSKVDVKGVGIGAPNGNYYKGTIEYPPNLIWKGVLPIADKLKGYFTGVPVVLTNDANAAAIGEMMYGGAIGMKDFIVITLGTGLGSGIVVNGNLVYGHDGHAGELGHINVKLHGRDCGCGNKGCLETYVSATGLKRTVFRLLAERTVETELRKISFNDLTPKMVGELARKGDKLAMEAFDFTASILGAKLADAVGHTSPEAIFLLGGLAKASELLIEPTKRYMEESLLPIYRGKIKILPSALHDRNAGIMGASALVWRELDKQTNHEHVVI